MNKQKLFSTLQTITVNEEEVGEKIVEMQEVVTNGNSFVSQLSLNRYLHTRLVDLDLTKRLELFSTLYSYGFVYDENGLYFGTFDYDQLVELLKVKYNLDNIYELDNLYVEGVLEGNDILGDAIEIEEGDSIYLGELLEQFVFSGNGMNIGDTPRLTFMLIAKKALLGTAIANKNIEKLLNGEKEIYDISPLF